MITTSVKKTTKINTCTSFQKVILSIPSSHPNTTEADAIHKSHCLSSIHQTHKNLSFLNSCVNSRSFLRTELFSSSGDGGSCFRSVFSRIGDSSFITSSSCCVKTRSRMSGEWTGGKWLGWERRDEMTDFFNLLQIQLLHVVLSPTTDQKIQFQEAVLLAAIHESRLTVLQR